MSKTLYIIDDKKAINKLKNKIKKGDIAITFNFFIKENLKRQEIKTKEASEYVDHDINKKCNAWLKEWSNKKTIDGTNFKEFCIFEGISYWWFCDTFLWQHPIHKRTFYSLFYYTSVLLNCIKKEKIDKIVSYTNNNLINSVLNGIEKKHRIIVQINNNKIISVVKDNKAHLMERIKNIKFKIRNKFARRNYKSIGNKELLFITYTSLYKRGKDLFLKGIIDKLNDKINYAIIDLDYTRDIKNINKGIKERKKNSYIPFEYFLSRDNDAKRFFLEKWDNLKNNKEFHRSLDYRGISFWNIMKKQFEFVFRCRLPESADYIKTSENMINSINPKLIFIIDETFMYGRSVIISAKNKNIKTIALQHGLIFEESFEYLNNKEDKKELDAPIADLILVMGKYVKNLLTKESNYESKEIMITGQPRYEIFNKIKKEKTKKDNTKKVVFISQPLVEEESGSLVETTFTAFSQLEKKRDDIKFIIKLHPREENSKYYEYLANKYKISPIIIKNLPIEEVLKDSDAVITMHSAVGMEALLLRKPLIIVNTTGKDDVFRYSSKYTPRCTNSLELLRVLENIEKLKPDKKFLKYHLSFPKEGSVKKIINLINKTMKE